MYDFGLNVGEGCYVYDAEVSVNNRHYGKKELRRVYLKCKDIIDNPYSEVSPQRMILDQYEDETCDEETLDPLLKVYWTRGLGTLGSSALISNTISQYVGGGFGGVTRVTDKNGVVVYDDTSANVNENVMVTHPKIDIEGNDITVSSESDKFCNVYSVDGRYIGNYRLIDGGVKITLNSPGVYILKIGEYSFKIMI